MDEIEKVQKMDEIEKSKKWTKAKIWSATIFKVNAS
jgi:hypothetical protein